MTHHLRRRIRHLGQDGQVHAFALYSLSREGKQIEHAQTIDLETGRVSCSCEAFQYRHAHKGANLVAWIEGHENAPCKHLQRASEWLNSHGFLAHLIVNLRPCKVCGVADAEFECCDDWYGRNVVGFICNVCATQSAADSMGVPSDTIERFLASHGPTDAEKQAETEYFANERKRDAFADYVESQSLIQIEDMSEEMELEEPEYVDNDARCGLRKVTA